MFATIARGVVDLLVPAVCDLCAGDAADGPCGRICARCWLEARPDAARGAAERDVIAAAPYDGPVGLAVRLLKFDGRPDLAAPLGAYMAEALALAWPGRTPDAVAHVPLGAERRRSRGYDQAALLADEVARRLGVPRLDPLRRLRETPPQTGLDASARRRNVAGAFDVPAEARARVRGARLALVDDVVSTGATAEAAAAALRAAGAAEVVVLAAARAAGGAA